MGSGLVKKWALFYKFNRNERAIKNHLLRRIVSIVTGALPDLHDSWRRSTARSVALRPIRSRWAGCSAAATATAFTLSGVCATSLDFYMAYRWLHQLDLEDRVPHSSVFSVNRLGRFHKSGIQRFIWSVRLARELVWTCSINRKPLSGQPTSNYNS